MEIIIDKKWDFTLFKKKEQLLLSVLCGSIGIYELNILLTPAEVEMYNIEGEKYILYLARLIQKNPDNYKSRHEKISNNELSA